MNNKCFEQTLPNDLDKDQIGAIFQTAFDIIKMAKMIQKSRINLSPVRQSRVGSLSRSYTFVFVFLFFLFFLFFFFFCHFSISNLMLENHQFCYTIHTITYIHYIQFLRKQHLKNHTDEKPFSCMYNMPKKFLSGL